MTRKEERVAHAMSFESKDIESEELKEIVRLAIYEGSTWADKTMIEKACKWLKSYRQDSPDGISYIAGIVNDKTIEDFRKAMEE